jgi:hypothetical protein
MPPPHLSDRLSGKIDQLLSIGTAFAKNDGVMFTVPQLRTLLLTLAIGGPLAGSCCAGYGRQTLVVEADYSYEAVCRWIEKNVDAIQKSSGAKILETRGDLVTVQLESKYGIERFRIRRTGKRGDYQAKFVDRSEGTLTNYTYRIVVTSLEGGRSQIEITMTAFSEENNGVSINIELRRALRLMRDYLEPRLTKQ